MTMVRSCLCPRLKPQSTSPRIAGIYARCTQVRRVHTRTEAGPTRAEGGLRVSTIFSVLAIIGLSATAYGVYDFYSSFAIWPAELREDLRPAIRAQQKGDLALSERYLRRAWQTCLTLSKDKLGQDPWLKISGIACKLGEVLEAANLPEKAYEIYAECCALMQSSAAANELSLPERRRTIALALHLGELSEHLRKEEEEQWLLWSVEEFIRISRATTGNPALHMDQPEATELILPNWTQKDEFEVALEALGSCYARQGNLEYALTLYLRALSLILPPTSPQARADVSPERRCRAAEIMTVISSLLINKEPSSNRIEQAKLWCTKGIEIAEKARNELAQSRTTLPDCERVWAVLLFNMGAVLEMQDDREAAKEHFKRALDHSRKVGMEEGVMEADGALARLSTSNPPARIPTN
ncbi:hypothetical protein K439DRAFT_852412 [Ramaria rubella]|nr:hypothetical protein K439DRAFT_852412 [Ramaria rubella]